MRRLLPRLRAVALIIVTLLTAAPITAGAPSGSAPSTAATNLPALAPSADATTIGGFVVVTGYPGDRREVPLDISVDAGVQPTGVSFENGAVEYGGVPLNGSSWVSVETSSEGRPVVRVRIPPDQQPADYPAAVRIAGDETSAVGILIRVEGVRATDFVFEQEAYEIDGAAGWPLTSSTQSLSYRVRNDGDTVIAGEFSVGAATLFSTFVPFGRSRDIILFPGEEIVGTVAGSAPPTAVLTPQAQVVIAYTASGVNPGAYVEASSGEPTWAIPWFVLSSVAMVIVAGTAAGMLLHRRARRMALSDNSGASRASTT